MPSVEREEFYGPSPALARATQKAEAGKTRALVGVLMLVVVVVVMGFGGVEPVDPIKMALPLMVLFFGVYNVIGGPLQARRHGQEVTQLTAAPPADVVWYALTEEGLSIEADMQNDFPGGRLVAPWSTMETLEPYPDSSDLRLTFRPVSGAKSATARLGADRKRADGVLFGERMRALFEQRATGRTAPGPQGA